MIYCPLHAEKLTTLPAKVRAVQICTLVFRNPSCHVVNCLLCFQYLPKLRERYAVHQQQAVPDPKSQEKQKMREPAPTVKPEQPPPELPAEAEIVMATMASIKEPEPEPKRVSCRRNGPVCLGLVR